MDLGQKYTNSVKAALKEAALGEPFDFHVNGPGIWPLVSPDGKPLGPGPGWMIVVAIRGGVDQPDIVVHFPLPGWAPSEEAFRNVSAQLLEAARDIRDQKQNNELAAARAAFQKQMKGEAA